MANIKTQLDILNSALTRKREVLNQIYELTQQQTRQQTQNVILMNANSTAELDVIPGSTSSQDDLVEKKQALIDQIESLDNAFQLTYERIRGTLNQQKDLYQVEISTLRMNIQEVGEVDIAIRVLEKRNEALWIGTSQLPRKKSVSKPLPRQVTATYSNMKKPNLFQGFDETK